MMLILFGYMELPKAVTMAEVTIGKGNFTFPFGLNLEVMSESPVRVQRRNFG